MRDPHETCLEIENHLPLWAGGDLEPDVHASVEGHLSRCEACSRAAVRARAARVALERGLRDGAERMGIGRDPWPAIRASLRTEGLVDAAEGAPLARPVFRRRSWAWPAAAAVLVGLFLAGTWLPSGGDPTGGDPTPPLAGVVNPPKNTKPRDSGATVPVESGSSHRASPIVAVPAGLMRLAPGEPRMRDTAWVFRTGASPDATALEGASPLAPAGHRDPREGVPVSLERVQLLPSK
ncbi:MAG: zf-HC2 domain-containing protein [Planctomycetota bacterium]